MMNSTSLRLGRALFGCCAILVAAAPALAADIIIDNVPGTGFTVLLGNWSTNTATQDYGANYYRMSAVVGTATGEVEWRPTITTAGNYQVSVWYPGSTSNTAGAPYTVEFDGGSQGASINQQSGGGAWVSLGTFPFAVGTTGRVWLSNSTRSSGRVCADAVKFSGPLVPADLTMAVNPAGAGTTTPAVGGPYTKGGGEVVSISATAGAGYNFQSWQVSAGSAVAAPTSASTTVTMDQSKTVTAVFAPVAPEFRCMWVTRFEWPSTTDTADVIKGRIDTMMQNLQTANFNAVMFQMRGQCDTLYPSPYEPWSPLIVSGGAAPGTDIGWDPMAYAIKSAHDHGLEFHAYINTHTCWAMGSSCAYSEPGYANHIFFQHCNAADPAHRDWLLHNNSGLDVNDNLPNKTVGTPVQCDESNYVWMAPGVPDMQAYVRKQIMYVVTHYDGSDPVNRPAIQAVHWDRIRTPSSSSTQLQYSHDPISVARFNGGEANPDNLDFFAWTRDNVSRFTQDIYAEINEARPEVIVSSSPLGLYAGSHYTAYGYPTSDCGYQYEYTCVHQDGQGWLARGSMDILNPQIYWAELAWRSTAPHFSEVAPDWINNRSGRFMCPGHIGAVGTHPVESIVGEIKTTRSLGGQGDVVFSYGMWDNSSFNGWAGFTDPVNGCYQQPAPMPAMPWKTAPTQGMLIGTVYGVDGSTPVTDARITRNGSTYTALSSGDGLYSMLKVAPGTYTLTLTKSGLGTKTATATVTAGQVTRVDFSFGSTPPNPPVIQLPQPQPQTVCPGATATFTVNATGGAPLTYQWQKDTTDIANGPHYSGATTATLSVTNVSATEAGAYRCRVTNGDGPATSDAAALTVKPIVAADFNASCTVDDADFGVFLGCATGANVPYAGALPPTCTLTPNGGGIIAADFDGDGDVDTDDFGTFQRCYSGPTGAVDPTCAN
jgi:uncharacterized lipoprotein YddW (UPF0748 family)